MTMWTVIKVDDGIRLTFTDRTPGGSLLADFAITFTPREMGAFAASCIGRLIEADRPLAEQLIESARVHIIESQQ